MEQEFVCIDVRKHHDGDNHKEDEEGNILVDDRQWAVCLSRVVKIKEDWINTSDHINLTVGTQDRSLFVVGKRYTLTIAAK